jgi:hypothetical protein
MFLSLMGLCIIIKHGISGEMDREFHYYMTHLIALRADLLNKSNPNLIQHPVPSL